MAQETEEIKSKIDIIELIGGYIKLIPAGANHRALCPFHNEKTPSMMVSQPKQIWKCFGCGEGGDIFDFIMKIEGVEFPEALKILAYKAGVVLKNRDFNKDNKNSRLYAVLDLTVRYWQKVLADSPRAETIRAYLKDRGLSPEVIEDFKLGYAIDSWDDLSQFLIKKGYQENEIFLSGLSVKKDKGTGYYDRFRGRVMFPIIDLSGRTIGFGGRTMSKEDTAKYINTPQTTVYNKSRVLYGLYQAKESIKENNLCVLVEGYMDVIPSHQANVKNVVSISGTALTDDQIKILKRYTNNLALALDMDAAGRRAAERSIEVALGQEMNVKIVNLPQGKDPGECIKNNPDDWQKSIQSAQSVMNYYFERALEGRNVDQPVDKKIITKILLEKINQISNKVEQDHWLKELAQRLSVSENILREIIVKIKPLSQPESKTDSPDSSIKSAPLDRDLMLIKKILSLIFAFPEHLKHLTKSLPVDFLENEMAINLYKEAVLYYTKNTGVKKDTVDNSEKDDDSDLFDVLKHRFEGNKSDSESLKLLDEAFLLSQKDFTDLSEKEIKFELDSLIQSLKDNYVKKSIDVLKLNLEKIEKEFQNNQGDKKLKGEIDKISLKLSDLIKQKNNS